MAIIAVAAASVPKLIEECVRAGIQSGIVWASGFAEAGGDGVRLQRELVDICAETGFQLCGPNSIGIVNYWLPMIGSFASTLVAADQLLPGNISMVSQSGGIGVMTQAMAQMAGFGFRFNVSSGNEVALTTSDFLAAFAEDPKTKIIASYVEGLRDGPRFIAAIERARSARKPVVLIKAGVSAASARAAAAHTGALAGEDRVWQAIFREQGVITAESHRELLDIALFLSSIDLATLPAGKRVAIVTFGGGGGVLSTDLCSRYGLETPTLTQTTMDHLVPIMPPIASVSNPIDLTPDTFKPEWLAQFPRVLDAIAADPNIDIVFLPLTAMARGADEVGRALIEFRRRTKKTVCVSWTIPPKEGFDLVVADGMYVFPEPSRAIGVLAKVAAYATTKPREHLKSAKVHAFDWNVFVSRPESGTVVSEDSCHRILRAAGLCVAEGRLANSENEAAEVARTVEFPVAIKGISSDVTHRAAAGLLELDLRSETELREAYRRLASHSVAKGVALDGLYVQHMEQGRLELLVSAFRDPVFGVMVTCGAGGNLAEIIDDVTLERAPFDSRQALTVLKRLRIIRGAARLDSSANVEAVADFVSRFSELAASAPWHRFVFEVNPIKWHSNNVVAVDGLLIIEEP